jgi:hypothetical protein
LQQKQQNPKCLGLDRYYLACLDETELPPLSDLYIRETRDRFLSAQHNATCNFLRPTFREPLSAFRKGPLLLAEV